MYALCSNNFTLLFLNLFIFFAIVQIFLSLITGADNLARLPPYLENFASARGAAKNVFEIIDRKSKIDPINNRGIVLDETKIKGNIEFKNIYFNYPSRPDVEVLTDIKCTHQTSKLSLKYINKISDIKRFKFKSRGWSNDSSGWTFGQWKIDLLAPCAAFLQSRQGSNFHRWFRHSRDKYQFTAIEYSDCRSRAGAICDDYR